jgi:hypothetical protein
MVRIALWAIRIYLLILLTLIGLKFARVFTNTGPNPQAPGTPIEKAAKPK